MVQDVRGIQPDLEALGLRHAKHLAHRGVEGPLPRQGHRLTANSAARSRLGVLEQDLSRFRVGHGLQRTERAKRGGDGETLRKRHRLHRLIGRRNGDQRRKILGTEVRSIEWPVGCRLVQETRIEFKPDLRF